MSTQAALSAMNTHFKESLPRLQRAQVVRFGPEVPVSCDGCE